MLYRILLFIVIMSSVVSCSGLKKVKKFNKEKAVLGLKKEATSGPYSVYDLFIYPNGYAVYEGFVNVEKYGLYAKKMTKQEIKTLIEEFDKSDFFSFKDQYSIPSPDLPVITLIYNKEKGRNKKVVGSIDRPRKLTELQVILEQIAKSEDMIKIEEYEILRKSQEVEEEKIVEPEYKISSEIIIETSSSIFMAQWIKKYTEYDVRLVTKISDELNLWVISYNTSAISPNDMLDLLNADADIKKAEFNKRISSRNK